MVRKAGGRFRGIEGSDDPLKTGHVICGNEYVHGELVKILKALDKWSDGSKLAPSSASNGSALPAKMLKTTPCTVAGTRRVPEVDR